MQEHPQSPVEPGSPIIGKHPLDQIDLAEPAGSFDQADAGERGVAQAAAELKLPHRVHIHANNLGLPGNWTTTLDTMQARVLERLREIPEPNEASPESYLSFMRAGTVRQLFLLMGSFPKVFW